jgi:hypothetical protein
LLARLQGSGLFAGSIFKIHSIPNWPENDSYDPSTDVLSNLPALLIGELLNLLIVGFDLGANHRAVRVLVLDLHSVHWLRVTPRATGQRETNDHRDTGLTPHSLSPAAGSSNRSFTG